VLELYEEPYDEKKPMVCFDELPYQMVAEKRTPLPQKPGRPQRYDYEYERKGMVNIFAFFEPKQGFGDTPGCYRSTHGGGFRLRAMRRVVDEHYPEAEKVRVVVLDNLNTHTGAALYQAFEPEEARRILAAVGVSLHAQARFMAEHGGGRALGAFTAVLGTSHPRYREAWEGSRSMATEAQ